MGMRSILAGAAAAAAMTLAFGAGSAHAATVLDVNWNASCSKATCFDDNGRFTQTFSGGKGPVNVGQLLLDRGVLGVLDDKTFRLSFQIDGKELGSWGSYNMGGIGGDELSFSGADFTWNPEDGDLVLVLEIVPPPKAGAGGGGFFRAANDDGGLGEGDNSAFDGPPNTQGGEGDGPIRGPAGPVPEPSAWALMITGFGMAGALVRRRRAVLPVQPLA
jgi:hypothetical protein